MVEIHCETLEDARFREETDFVISALEENPKEILELTWGFGCNPVSWVPVKVRASTIRDFLADAVRQSVFEVGGADAFITRPTDELMVTLCHENDIHLTSPAESCFSRFTDRWKSQGILWFRRDDDVSDWTDFTKR
jgi:hypothetical protein